MDINGARIFGTFKADKARVLWLSGRLYIVHKPGSAILTRVLNVPNLPVKSAGTYKAITAGGEALRIQRPTCGCQRDKALGQLTVEQIMDMAGEQVAV